jgi:hypothetical protein
MFTLTPGKLVFESRPFLDRVSGLVPRLCRLLAVQLWSIDMDGGMIQTAELTGYNRDEIRAPASVRWNSLSGGSPSLKIGWKSFDHFVANTPLSI